MNVPSYQFLAFALVGALVFNLSAALAWRRLVLLVLNVAFFCTFLHGPASAAPYLAFLAVGYAGVRLLARRPSRGLLVAFVAAVLFGFFLLKRYTFIPSGLFVPWPYVAVGLSYVFFRVLHLVIDAGQGALETAPGPVSFINYTLNFTGLVSGPIQLYPDYQRTAEGERLSLDLFDLAWSAERIVLGFFKVAVVSTALLFWQKGHIADLAIAASPGARALDVALIGAIYPVFLYANFSGYTDVVIGVARLYRLRLPENFDKPFVAENFISFWSRWHITLSHWLKTYVYTPLLMATMRRAPSLDAEPYLAVFAYFVTFFLVGAWHGQTSVFLFFGVLQGGGVAANKLYQVAMTARLGRKGYRALAARPLYRAASRGLTFTWFAFTMLWFWSSWGQLGALAADAGPGALAAGWALVFAAATAVLALGAALDAAMTARASAGATAPAPPSRYRRTAAATAMAVAVVVSTLLLSGPAPDIVYKSF